MKPNAKVKVGLRRRTTFVEPGVPTRRVDVHVAPPRYTERRRGKPGAGHKRGRAVMSARPTR